MITYDAPLEALFRAINESPDEMFIEAVGEYLDLPLFMKHMAAQNFLAQPDGVLGYKGANNFYLYRFENSSRSQFIMWDEDVALFSADLSILQEHDRNVLMRRAMSVPELSAAYFDALRAATDSAAELVGGVSWLEREIQLQRSIVDAAIRADSLKPYTNGQYAAAADGLVEFARVRPGYVLSQLPSTADLRSHLVWRDERPSASLAWLTEQCRKRCPDDTAPAAHAWTGGVCRAGQGPPRPRCGPASARSARAPLD